MKWYMKALSDYATFSGRSSRTEYWTFFFGNFVLGFCLGFSLGIYGAVTKTQPPINLLGGFLQLALFVPSLAVGVRRMHDRNHSGWWLLFPFVNFVMLCLPGTEGSNHYGPDPWDGSGDRQESQKLAA
jgi:uncharacterized membrane protein YhaH (DUF805 family)